MVSYGRDVNRRGARSVPIEGLEYIKRKILVNLSIRAWRESGGWLAC